MYQDSSRVIFEFQITNDKYVDLYDINWSLDTGLETIYSDKTFNLTVNNTIFVYVEYEYSQPGNYTVTARAQNALTDDQESISIVMEYIDVSNLSMLYNSSKVAIFEFMVTNHFFGTKSINWTMDTGEETIVAKEIATLLSEEYMFVFVKYNYTSSDTYNVVATAMNSSSDSANLAVTIS